MHLESDGDPKEIQLRDYDPEPPAEPGEIWTVQVNPLTGETVAWRVVSDDEVEQWKEANPDAHDDDPDEEE